MMLRLSTNPISFESDFIPSCSTHNLKLCPIRLQASWNEPAEMPHRQDEEQWLSITKIWNSQKVREEGGLVTFSLWNTMMTTACHQEPAALPFKTAHWPGYLAPLTRAFQWKKAALTPTWQCAEASVTVQRGDTQGPECNVHISNRACFYVCQERARWYQCAPISKLSNFKTRFKIFPTKLWYYG